MNKKGFTNQIMILIILGIVLGAIMVLIFVIQLAGPLFSTGATQFTELFTVASQVEGPSNLSESAGTVIAPATNMIGQLEWIGFTLIILLFVAFIGVCFFVRNYPFLIVIWIGMIILLVLLSLFLTVSYQEMKQTDNYIKTAAEAWESTDFLLSHMPHIIAGMGILGGIVLFMLISRDPEGEANII